MGHVKTWLTGIGLGYAVPNFEAAGIVTPQALAELNVAHFESLGVDNPEDRRKLFFLVQRIKMAAKENTATSASSSTTPSSASASAQNNNTTTTQDQVEQVLIKTTSSSTHDNDDNRSPFIKSKTTNKDNMPDETGNAESSLAIKDVAASHYPEDEEEQDLKKHPLAASNVSSAKASEEIGHQVETAETSTEVKEEDASENKEDIAAIEPKEGMSDAAVQVEEMILGEEQSNVPSAAGTPPAAVIAIGVSSSDGGASSCCGNSTLTVSTSTSTISTNKSRGPPSPERNKNHIDYYNTTANNNKAALARRKMSKLTTPIRRPTAVSSSVSGVDGSVTSTVAMTISDRSSSQTAAPFSPLTMVKSSNDDTPGSDANDGHTKVRQEEDEHHEYYEEEKKQDISIAEDDEDGTVEMTNQNNYNDDPHQSNSAISAGESRRVSKRLIEKQWASQKNENQRLTTGTKSSNSRTHQTATKSKQATTAAAARTTTPAMSNSTRKATGSTIRRASSDGGILLHRQSGVPAPKTSRRTTTGTSKNVPKSARTGKELSSIPSDSIAPMSPLIALTDQVDATAHLTKQQQRGRRTSTTSRRTQSDSESEGSSSSIGLNKNRKHSHSVERHHHQYRQRNRSSTSDSSSGTPQKRASYRRRHSEMIVSNRKRTDSHASTSSDDEIDLPVLGYRGSAAAAGVEMLSFESQIAALRDDNEQEHELFGKVASIVAATGTGSDDEDLMRIRVVVRKRPMSRFEVTNAGNIDVIQPLDYGDYGRILTYQPKTRVDLTKEIDTIPFSFDNVFDDTASNVQIYERAVRNLIPSFFDGQWASIFAYGQTGSGKTFTMMGSSLTTNGATETENLGLYYLAALDIFQALKTEDFQDYSIGVSLFEIYGGKLYDLLNDRTLVKCLEDSKGKVCFPGLTDHDVGSPDELMGLIEKGACRRSTGTTSRNADSSRSHAVLQLHLRTMTGSGRRRKQVEHSRLSFIDLAGNERGADTYCADRATRMEGAEINTSLLALKEVIRALATGGSMTHVPFRGSKLTQVLKESFVGNNCRSIMIACISPNIGNVEQTLNTLRYANRVKERNAETGELSVVPDGTSTRRTSSAVQRSLSSSFSDSFCGGGLSSLMNQKQRQQHSSSDREQSEGGNTTDILDELLASPSPAVTDSEGPGPIYLTNGTNSSNDLMPPHPRHAVRQLLTEHEAAIPVLLNMLQDEMSLVSDTESHGGIEEYTAQLDCMQENQLELFAKLRTMIQAYRDARESSPNNPEILSDDDSFEDLRD